MKLLAILCWRSVVGGSLEKKTSFLRPLAPRHLRDELRCRLVLHFSTIFVSFLTGQFDLCVFENTYVRPLRSTVAEVRILPSNGAQTADGRRTYEWAESDQPGRRQA